MEIEIAKHLFDLRTACERIQSFTAGLTLESYEASTLVRSAVERQMEILGEAASRLRRDAPEVFEKLPWSHALIGMRNRLAHGYDTIDDGIVWNVVQEAVPTLLAHLDPVSGGDPG